MSSNWKDLESQYWRRMRCCMHCHVPCDRNVIPGWILPVCFKGSFPLPAQLFLLKSWDWHAYSFRGFCNTIWVFSLLPTVINMILEMVWFSFPCEMYPGQSLRKRSSFHKTRGFCWYIKEDMLWNREGQRYALLQAVVNIFYIKKCSQQIC